MMQDTLLAFLGQWLPLTPADVQAFERYIEPVRYARGQRLFDADTPVDELVLLEHGLVRAWYLQRDREINLRLLCAPAAALPYNSYLAQTPPDETLEALSDVAGYRVRFRRYCRDNPGLLAESVGRLLAERHFLALQRRVRMLQGRSAKARYQYFLQHMDPDIVTQTPAYHVASYLGITAESLSRVKRDLEKNQ